MIRKIKDNLGVNYAAAVVGGPPGYIVKVDIPDAPTFNSGYFINYAFNPVPPSWGLGAGYTVSGAGPQKVFSNVNNGGALSEVTIVNKATGVVYLSFNGTGFNINNSLPLEYNESINHEDKITQIWAYCPSGNTVIIGQGLFLGWTPVGVNN